MTDRVVFLDIDGVLNGHEFDVGAQSCRINRNCIVQLNRLIRETDCKFVLSSAWRYMLLERDEFPAAMTLKGFEYLLRTHGAVGFTLIGTTRSDEEMGWGIRNNVPVRGKLISWWLRENGPVGRYVVIDDDDGDISEQGHPFVRTQGDCGLMDGTCTEAIRILKGEQPNA